ncbi:MAG: hypothetical protein IIY29_00210, partial [Firmicutes bacterium]|nr:hypothetical protein [Bacillota bacterium]
MKSFSKKLLGVVLSVAMIITMTPFTAFPSQAATNLDGGLEGQDADVFSALGFDTSELPEGYDPDNQDNPYGRDIITGNDVFELSVAGAGTAMYGKDDNEVAPSGISGSSSGGEIGMAMYASAAGDFDGDGLPGEVVYVGFDKVEYESNQSIASTLQLRIYDGQKNSYGSIKNLDSVTPDDTGAQWRPRVDKQWDRYDMYWQNLLQVTAGDYDGDGIGEIAVFVGQKDAPRIDVYKYQKTSSSAPGDWIDMANWTRVWSHALSGTYVPNMVSLVSGDFNMDGVDDLGIASGRSVFMTTAVSKVIRYNDSSQAVMLWGDRERMLQNSSPIDLNTDELGEQSRVSLIKGDLNGDGIAELIATGQPTEDLMQFQFIETSRTSGNSKRTVLTYAYDRDGGLMVNTSDLMEPVKGEFQTSTTEDGETTYWVSGNGFDEIYYSMPFMRTNSAVFWPEGSEYAYLYLDSCLYQNVENSLSLKCELDEEKYDGEHELKPGDGKAWGAYSGGEQVPYAEYGAAASDINGNGYDILVTNSFCEHSSEVNGQHMTQYAVVYGNKEDGSLKANITCDSAQTEEYNAVAMTFLNCDKDTVLKEYTGQHYLSYSDPKVLAIIAAAPYFEDVDEATGYEFAGNNTTSWGQTHGTGDGTSKGLSFSFGIQNHHEFAWLGLDWEIEYSVAYTLDYEYSETTTYEYTMTFGTYGDQDAVAFFSVPTENFLYRVKIPDGNGGYIEDYTTESRTYQPVYQVLTLDYYEEIQGDYDELPPIAGEALTSTPGHPESYPSSSSGYDVIVEWDQDPAGVGYGNGSIEQEIAVSTEKETSYAMGAEVEFSMVTGGKAMTGAGGHDNTGGLGFSLNPTGGWADIDIEGTTIAAEVANMPVEFQQYGYYFNWKLFSYNYKFKDKKNKKTSVPVISYIVNDVAAPPSLPDDFQQDYDRTTSDTNVLTWTYDGTASEFIIHKYFDFPVGGGIQEIARIRPGDADHYLVKKKDGVSYKEYFFEDTNLTPYTEYQYAIQVERPAPMPPLSTPSALTTARTRAANGYPNITISESDNEQDGKLQVYPDKNEYLTASITGPGGESIANYYSTVSYQWQKKNKGAWEDLIGETNKTLTFASAGGSTAGDYRCRANVITKADNAAITAYSDTVTLIHDKRTSVIEEASVTDMTNGGIQLYAKVANAHSDSASIPGGSVNFNLTSTATGQVYQYSTALSAEGTAVAILDDELPEGMYNVEVYYSGSFIFKSCSTEVLYLSQREADYDISMPASVTYGDQAEILFRKVTKSGGVTEADNVRADANGITAYRAAPLSRAMLSGATAYSSGTDVVAGQPYFYTDEDDVNWYFTAPVSGAVSEFDTVHRFALFGSNQSDFIKLNNKTDSYILQDGIGAGVYLLSMTKDGNTAYGSFEVLPRPVTLQIPLDLTAGESQTEAAEDITFSQLSLVNGSWADCDITGEVFNEGDTSIGPVFRNSAGKEFQRNQVRKLCGAYTITGTKQLANYKIQYRSGQLTVQGATHTLSVGARPFAGLNVGKVFMLSPQVDVATGPLDDTVHSFTKEIQSGVRMILSAQPDDGYEIYDWYINGVAQNNTGSTLVYTMLAEPTTIEVQFAIKQNTLTFGAIGDEGGGTLTCSDSTLTSGSVIRLNSHFTFEAKAKEGYHFKEWRYTEQGLGTAYNNEDSGQMESTFDFYMPGISCSLYAVFERDGYVFNYIDGNNADGLVATYINEDGITATARSGNRIKGGTEITIAPADGYVWDASRQYASTGSQGTADYDTGTYTLTLDQDTTVYGWTEQEKYDLTLAFDYTADSAAEKLPNAAITYYIGDRDETFRFDADERTKTIPAVPGGTTVTVQIEAPDWVDLEGWTSSGTKVFTSPTMDPLATEIPGDGKVQRGRSYVFTSEADNTDYYFTAPFNGKVKKLDVPFVELYSTGATYTIPALNGNDTLTVYLKEKSIHTVTMANIDGQGTYEPTLPEGGYASAPTDDGREVVKVHDGDDLTILVRPAQGTTVSYWETTPEGSTAVKSPATSLRYTIPGIDRNYEFRPVFSSTTYNTVSWPTISEKLNQLTVNPESGYITSVESG